MELADGLVTASHRALTLQDVNLHAGLIVGRSREDFGLPCGNRRVALDELGEHAAARLDAERQWSYVEQEDVFDVALEYAGLDRRAHRNDFVRIHALVRRLLDQVASRIHYLRHARHAANEDQFVTFVGRDARVLQTIPDRRNGALEQIIAKLLHLRTREFGADVFRAAGVRRNERQIDLIDLRAGERDFGLLGFFFDALEGVGLLAQVHAVLLFEFIKNPIHDAPIPIVTAQIDRKSVV